MRWSRRFRLRPLNRTKGSIGRYRWLICGLLFAATAINYVDRQIIGVLKPTLQLEFGWTEGAFADVIFWFQAAYALGYIGFGKLVDKLGARAGYAACMVLWTIAHVAHACVASIAGFAAVRFALGLGESGNFPAGLKAIAEWFPQRERAFATGIFNAGSNVGAILTPLIVPYSHVQHRESTDPDHRMTDPIIGLETGSPRLFEIFMKGKAYPYKAKQWRDVVLKGMEILNKHNWFPFCTFIIGLPGETDADTKESLNLLYELRDAKGTFVPTFFVPLEDTRMEQKESAKLIEMTDLQWEFFYTCWKYNLHFWKGTASTMKFSLGVPFYYYMLGRKLFGDGIKYPLYRFAGVPDRFMRKHLYLDFTGYKRSSRVMQAPVNEILPGFLSVREKGLNMIDASQLHHIAPPVNVGTEGVPAASN